MASGGAWWVVGVVGEWWVVVVLVIVVIVAAAATLIRCGTHKMCSQASPSFLVPEPKQCMMASHDRLICQLGAS